MCINDVAFLFFFTLQSFTYVSGYRLRGAAFNCLDRSD